MRGLLIAIGIGLAAMLVVAALLLVTTGKGYIFSLSAGHPNHRPGAAIAALGTLAVSFVTCVALHALAHAYPRRYYQLMWWRDLAFASGVAAGLFTVAMFAWRQFGYGTP